MILNHMYGGRRMIETMLTLLCRMSKISIVLACGVVCPATHPQMIALDTVGTVRVGETLIKKHKKKTHKYIANKICTNTRKLQWQCLAP